MVCGRVDARARHGPFDTTGSLGYSSSSLPTPALFHPRLYPPYAPTLTRVRSGITPECAVCGPTAAPLRQDRQTPRGAAAAAL